MTEVTTFKTDWVPGKLYKMISETPELLHNPMYSPAQVDCMGSLDEETISYTKIQIKFKPTESSHELRLGDVFMFIDNEFVDEQRYIEHHTDAHHPSLPGGPSFREAVIKSIEYIQVLVGEKICIYCAGALYNINFGQIKFVEAGKE